MLPPPRFSISGVRRAPARSASSRRDVERRAETITRGHRERGGKFLARCERRAVHDEVESAEIAIDARSRLDVRVGADVARKDEG